MNDLEITKCHLDGEGISYTVHEHRDPHPRDRVPFVSYTIEHGNTIYVFNQNKRLVFYTDRADLHLVK